MPKAASNKHAISMMQRSVSRRTHRLQRGARKCQAWNESIYLAGIIWLRPRRAELNVLHQH